MRWPPARHHLGSLSQPCHPSHMKCQIVRITQMYIGLTQCNSLTLPQPAVWSWTWKFGENTKQCRQPRHSSNTHASFVSKCCIMGYSVPSIAHMTFGNLAVKNRSTSILSAACGKPTCCPRHHATALSTAGSTRVRMTSLLYVPPSPEKDPEAKRWRVSKSLSDTGMSGLALFLNQTGAAWPGNMYLLLTSSFIWNKVNEWFLMFTFTVNESFKWRATSTRLQVKLLTIVIKWKKWINNS